MVLLSMSVANCNSASVDCLAPLTALTKEIITMKDPTITVMGSDQGVVIMVGCMGTSGVLAKTVTHFQTNALKIYPINVQCADPAGQSLWFINRMAATS